MGEAARKQNEQEGLHEDEYETRTGSRTLPRDDDAFARTQWDEYKDLGWERKRNQ